MTLARVNDIELDYERSGSGPALLMIMGMSGTALHWGEPLLTRLREHFEVIVFDHRGVGASTRLDGPITTAEMAADAAGLLRALELDSAHVFGISMGGMIAQELALAHPEVIRTLTLGCTYCGGEGSELAPSWVRDKLAEAMGSGERLRILRAAWEVEVSQALVDDKDAYARFLDISARRSVALEVVMEQMRACATHDTHERLAGGLGMPTLLIHGSEDNILPVGNGRMIASLLPGAQLEIFDGAGHLFFWDDPERSAELIRAHAACLTAPTS